MSLDRGKLDNVLPEKIVGQADAFRIDLGKHQHLTFGFVRDPAHVLWFEVVFNRDIVFVVDHVKFVELVALGGVGNNGLVFYRHKVAVTFFLLKRIDNAFQLPGRGVGSRHHEMPRDVVFQNGGGVLLDKVFPLGHFQ